MAAHAIGLVLMPPEPLPWDRKDFFKERKHERSESLGSVARWRDSSHHRDFNRWGSAEFRRPPGEFSFQLSVSVAFCFAQHAGKLAHPFSYLVFFFNFHYWKEFFSGLRFGGLFFAYLMCF